MCIFYFGIIRTTIAGFFSLGGMWTRHSPGCLLLKLWMGYGEGWGRSRGTGMACKSLEN